MRAGSTSLSTTAVDAGAGSSNACILRCAAAERADAMGLADGNDDAHEIDVLPAAGES